MTQTRESRLSRSIKVSFEFFPPKTPEAEAQLWQTATRLAAYRPEVVSVTYGAGGSTKAPTLNTVARLLRDSPLRAASHLTPLPPAPPDAM